MADAAHSRHGRYEMSFLTLILKNVWRQKLRTLLTLFGISIGIATILTLGAVAGGLESWFSSVLSTGEADFTIAQAQASDLAFSTIDEAALGPIRAMPEVERLDGVLLAVTPQGANPFFFVLGVRPETAELDGIGLIEGRLFVEDADEVVLGKIAALSLDLGVGDDLELFGTPHRVVGIFETGENMKDGAGYTALARLQRLTHKEGKLSMALVRTTPETDVASLTERIDGQFAGTLTTIKSVDEISRVDQGLEIVGAASWMISFLAVIIGGIGVMNTMIISVYDRIREIGVLKALGWRRRKVVAMILGESLVVGLGSIVAGGGMAAAGLAIVGSMPAARSLIEPTFSVALLAQAVTVALLVSLVGSLYPAVKAASLSPIEALRYE